MKKRFSYLLGLGTVFSIGVVASFTPVFALYKQNANNASFEITKENQVIEYKLEITNDDKSSSKEIYSYTYDSTVTTDATFNTTSLGSSFSLVNSSGTYVPSGWTQKNIYVKKNTRFVWKKYINNVPSELGTDIIGDEGLYSITPTYDGTDVFLGVTQLQKAIYLHTSSDWEKDSAWFSMYLFSDSGNFWMCANKQADHYYRFFIDNAKLATYKCIFVRKGPGDSTLSWDNKWNQAPSSDGYVIGGDYGQNCFGISGWDSGAWEDYSNE